LDRLVSKPDVDGVFIGPHDLSINMGIPEEYDSGEFEAYVEKIIKVCNKHKKGIGNHFSGNVEKQIQWAKKGMNIVIWSSDISVFVKTITDDFNRVKQELGEYTEIESVEVTL
jgi:4-hydroxy-2-oxoheptanedioate aldolase